MPRTCGVWLIGLLIFAAARTDAAEQSRGWGSSWTVPHSAEEKESRDLDQQMHAALRAQDWPKVTRLLEESEKLSPNSLPLAYATAVIAMKRQHYADAVSAFSHMLTLPAARKSARITSQIYSERAYAESLGGAYANSRADFERAIAADRTNDQAQNNYAWLLATCPQTQVRDGQRALSFARALNGKLDGRNPGVLDTLAAAQAEAGDLASAIKTQQRALSAAPKDKLATYQHHLVSYQHGQPLREAPTAPAIKINPDF